MGITKHSHHINIIFPLFIFTLTLEVSRCRLPRWQQKHHSISEETKSCPLFVRKVLHVFNKLPLLGFILRNERHHSLHWVAINVIKSGPVAYVEIVVLIREKCPNVVIISITDNIRLHQDTMSLIPRYIASPHVALVIFENIFLLLGIEFLFLVKFFIFGSL